MSNGSAGQRPAARRYNISEHRQTERGYPGNHFCDTSLVSPMKLFWPRPGVNTAHCNTVIRILPGKDPADPTKWDPYRLSNKIGNYGDHIRGYTAFRAGGNPSVTFFLGDPTTRPNGDNYRDNPASQLYWNIKRLVDAGKDKPGWAAMINDTRSDRAIIAKPKKMFVVMCAVYEYGTAQKGGPDIFEVPKGLAPGERPVLMDLGLGGGKDLLRFWDQLAEEPNADLDNFYKNYTIEDAVGLAPGAGAFFTFVPSQYDPDNAKPKRQERRVMTRDSVRNSGSHDKEEKEKVGFTAKMSFDYEGLSPDLSEFESDLMEKIPAWDDVLTFPSEQQQAEILWGVIKDRDDKPRPDVFKAAWADNPEWVPPADHDVWAQFRGKISVRVKPGDVDEEDEEDEIEETKPAARTRGVTKAPVIKPPVEDEDEEESDEEEVKPAARTRGVAQMSKRQAAKAAPVVEDDEEIEDDADEAEAPFDPKAAVEDDEEEIEEESKPATRTARTVAKAPATPAAKPATTTVRPPAAGVDKGNLQGVLAKMAAARAKKAGK